MAFTATQAGPCTIIEQATIYPSPQVRWLVLQVDLNYSKSWRMSYGSALFTNLHKGRYKVEAILFGSKGEIARESKTIVLGGCK